MEIQLDLCTLRPWREGDQESIVRHANNPRVVLHMRERFPQPYTRKDADEWIRLVANDSPLLNLAIVVNEEPAGGIGLMPGSDIHRISAEIGYWLGESFWARGIATCALRGMTRYAFETLAINRVFANVDADHAASIRVLEKAKYRCEGKMVGCAIKYGRVRDQLLYAITREELRTMS
jgi:[ribosomal protein S5]-alanine N-acetyltransferase